jgi:steroid delta-isomerase-like uncharacterized protein
MAGEASKAIYRRFVEEVVNGGNFDIVEELFSPQYLDHSAPPGAPGGAAGVKAVMGMFRTAFPDVHFTITQMVSEGDVVATFVNGEGTHNGPFMGTPPTGRHVRWSSTGFFRVQDGKIVEHWGVPDLLAIISQIGPGVQKEKGMTAEEVNLGHRSHKEWLEAHNPGVVDEIYPADCVIYGKRIPRAQRFGREGFKTYGASLYTAFPDLRINHDLVLTDDEGEYQAILWTMEGTNLGPFGAIPPSGHKVSISGVDVFRVEDGKIQELYLMPDTLTLLQQMGVIPTPGQ